MHQVSRRSLALLAGAALLAGCSRGGETLIMSTVAPTLVPTDEAPAIDRVVDSAVGVGLSALATKPDDNVCFSPLSAVMALGMVTAGASGAAREELEGLLGAPVEQLLPSLNALAGVLSAYEVDPGSIDDTKLPNRPALHRATNTVVRTGFTPEQPYLDALKLWFDSGLAEADLTSESGKRTLDAWVKHHTGGRVEKSAIRPSPTLVLVLQDALLFAARWAQAFADPAVDRDFTSADGSVAAVPTMRDVRRTPYAAAEGWHAVRLPFTEGFAATFYLPPTRTQPLTATVRDALVATLRPAAVDVSLPRFSVSEALDLQPLLTGLGAGSMFDAATDPLLGISDDSNLCVDQVVQQAVLRVTESGAVAAAVTEVGIRETSAPVADVEVAFDRPFVVELTHEQSGMPLMQAAIRTLPVA